MSKKQLFFTTAVLLATNTLTYYATPYISVAIDLMRLERQLAGPSEGGEYSLVDFTKESAGLPPTDQTDFRLEMDPDIYIIVSIPDRRLGQDPDKNRALAQSLVFSKDESLLFYNGMKLMLERHNYGWHPMLKIKTAP